MDPHWHALIVLDMGSRPGPDPAGGVIVIAANDGFLPGRVNFAIRCGSDVNLLQWLRSLPFSPSASAEYANGHPQATGGSLSRDDFERFVDVFRRTPARRVGQ
jgi:hypothetical protein